MTEHFPNLPQDDAAPNIFTTPIDMVRNGQTLPSDMVLGSVNESSTFAEIRILKLTGIGEYGPEYAWHARNIERELRLDPDFLQQKSAPYVMTTRPGFFWLPPARFEEFKGLIGHPDRPNEYTGEPSNVQEWFDDVKRTAVRDGKGYSYKVIDDDPNASPTHVFAHHGTPTGISDWFQRDNIAERNINILPDVTTIPEALTALTGLMQTQAGVPAQNVDNVLRFFTEVHDRYGIR
ncbi:MAG TPA: hypothetical protein VLG11_01225 [Candidatus Saccharimonadales bacterium]|nr:hypothetical protein [Candidatus Saccharimonadales bacterium]